MSLICIKPDAGARLIMVAVGQFMANRIRKSLSICALALVAGCGAPPGAPEPRRADMLRGSELYSTYCIACHTAQVHWRDKRLVQSWDDLRYQVSRWQKIAGQDWSREDIDDVAAYLNGVFYGLPCPLPGCRGSGVGEIKDPSVARQR